MGNQKSISKRHGVVFKNTTSFFPKSGERIKPGYEMKDCEVKLPLEPVDGSQIEVHFSIIPYNVILGLQ